MAIGFQCYRLLKRRVQDPVSDGARFWIVVAAVIGAGLGSRASAILEVVFAPALAPGLCHSEKSVVGALVGALFAVEAVKRACGVKRHTGDLFVYPKLVGLIVGRIGCFVYENPGCTLQTLPDALVSL